MTKDTPAEIAVTNLVKAFSVIDPRDITPHLMWLLEDLKGILKRDQFDEILDELLFTIALLKKET